MTPYQMTIRDLKFLLAFRHQPIVPYMGGFVYPREEARKIIKSLRRYKEAQA